MGKASRVRDQRDQQQKRQQQRNLWLATGGVVLAIIAMAAVLNRLNQAPSAPGPAKPTAADLNAPKSLRVAAAKVGFHPQLIPGVGQIEDKSASDAPAPNNSTLLKPGTVAPAFSLKTPQGDTVSLSDYAGKALLIEFFATSCPHCQAEAPHLQRPLQHAGHVPRADGLDQRRQRGRAQRVRVPPLLRTPVPGPARPRAEGRQLALAPGCPGRPPSPTTSRAIPPST